MQETYTVLKTHTSHKSKELFLYRQMGEIKVKTSINEQGNITNTDVIIQGTREY